MRTIQFTKMHGCGNDYIYIDNEKEKINSEDKSRLAQMLSDRHFGIGGDGVVFISSSTKADFEMEIYNLDGSKAQMCGNGIRCVAKYVFDKGKTSKTTISIISAGEIKYLDLTVQAGQVSTVKVNMGMPILEASQIPVISESERVIDELLEVEGTSYKMTCVSMGNPHAVIFMDDIQNLPLAKLGPFFENHKKFPQRINTEFIRVLDHETIQMRVYERGSGETLACGTGACAAVVACVLNNLTKDKVTVLLSGGSLDIFWDRNTNMVYMTGPATTVFEGSIAVDIK